MEQDDPNEAKAGEQLEMHDSPRPHLQAPRSSTTRDIPDIKHASQKFPGDGVEGIALTQALMSVASGGAYTQSNVALYDAVDRIEGHERLLADGEGNDLGTKNTGLAITSSASNASPGATIGADIGISHTIQQRN